MSTVNSPTRCNSTAAGPDRPAHEAPATPPGPAARWVRRIVVGAIGAYRAALSPLLGPHCRFVPSCSAYTAESVQRHGVVRGLGAGLRRLARCHPFHPGGIDPVP